MTIGLSTYAFFWQTHHTAPKPLSLCDIIAKADDWDVRLLQICDFPAIEGFDRTEVRELAATAQRRGIALELGTRGISPAHLRHYLDLAQQLDVVLVRSMVTREQAPTAEGLLAEVISDYEKAGVALALETYEQVPTARLVEIVDTIGTPSLGICLDPANSVAALETPRSTIDLTARHVRNLHVKDFVFTRQGGWVGFTYAGALLGEGLLDYDYLIDTVRPDERGINKIIEHWLVWQGDNETTCRVEDDWTLHNLHYLRRREPATAGTDPARAPRTPAPR